MRQPIRLFALLLPVLLLGCQKQTQAQHAQGMDKPATQSPSQTSTAQASTAEVNPVDMDKREDKRLQATDDKLVNKPSISPKGEGMMLQGTVRYLNLEGGFWGIIADNGQKILPKNLPQEYRKDGIRLSFSAQEITGMMTIQQWGKLSNLSDITVIGQVESQSADPRL
ncbi:hypothetical protein [Shewanella decolorationis]|uniref:Periplasmic protein n=1 Tax=Shewanella decolorationis S12 TaxID=1353536 RepID=A0ABN0PKR9_9GAMM|nr:hypothetical protein [Shewanella decolorationis]ESE40618.1 periplasmic protein [Shewanella decolorationis S12]GLR33106.1 hypothetical protein GCM10007922_26650 [Shewanella decolorationis]